MAHITTLQLIGAPGTGPYKIGSTITVRATFDAAVDVTGSPRLNLNLTAGIAYASTGAVSNVTQVNFTHVVDTGDTTSGQYLAVKSADLNGGTIFDHSTTDPSDLTVAGLDLVDEIVVDGIEPSFSFSAVSQPFATTGSVITIIVFSDKPMDGDVTAKIGDTTTDINTAASDLDHQLHTFIHTVRLADDAGPTLPIKVSGTDLAGYAIIDQTFTIPVGIDRTAPSAPAAPDIISEGPAGVTNTGTVAFSWAQSTAPISGISGYDIAYKKDGVALVVGVEDSVRYDADSLLPDTQYISVANTEDDAEYTCKIRSVSTLDITSSWSSWSAPLLVSTARPSCTVSISDAPLTNKNKITADIKFVKTGTITAVDVDGIVLENILAINASKGALTVVSPSHYTLDLYPLSAGKVSLQVLVGAGISLANHQPNLASAKIQLTYDPVRPTCSILGPSGLCSGVLSYKITFSKPVVGIDTGSLTVSGGTVATMTGKGTTWTAVITPDADARPFTIKIQVKDGEGTDAARNVNTASNTIQITYDDTVPTILHVGKSQDVSTGTTYRIDDTIRVNVTFSCPITIGAFNPYLYVEFRGTSTRRKIFKYISGEGSDTFVFSYRVGSEQPDSEVGVQSSGNILSIPLGSYLKNHAGTSLSLESPGDTLVDDALIVDPGYAISAYLGTSMSKNISASMAGVSGSSLGSNTIVSGIGDRNDLKVEMIAAPNEKWVPRIHKGWFYYQDSEYYLFARKATKTASVYTPGNPIDISISTEGYSIRKTVVNEPAAMVSATKARISRESITSLIGVKLNTVSISLAQITTDYQKATIEFKSNTITAADSVLVSYTYCDPFADGPIFVTGTIDGVAKTYTPVSSPLRVVLKLTGGVKLGTTNNYQYLVSGIPVELYRTSINEPMRQVPTVDSIEDVGEYCHTTTLNTASVSNYITVSGTSAVYVTYIPTELTSRFLQAEICAVDSNLRIRTMYKDISIIAAVTLSMIEDGILTSIDAKSFVNGNMLQLPATYIKSNGGQGTIAAGDRVAITYYVPNSWAYDGPYLYAYTDEAATIDTVKAEYESDPDGYWDTGGLPDSSSSYVQLNPLKDGVGSGFIYAVDSAAVKMIPKKLALDISSSSVLVNASTNSGQPARLRVRLLDKDRQPVQGEKVSMYSRGIQYVTRGAGNTDNVNTVPETINDGPIVINQVGVIKNGSFSAYAGWTTAFTAGKWVITWTTANRPALGVNYLVLFSPGLGKFADHGMYPADDTTNWRGELSAVWQPSHAEIHTSFGASLPNRTPNLSTEVGLWQSNRTIIETAAFSDSSVPKKVHLTLTTQSDEPGTLKALAYVTDITGSYPVSDAVVEWHALSGLFSHASSKPVNTVLTSITNKDGVASANYRPAKNDQIYAVSSTIQSNRINVGGDIA